MKKRWTALTGLVVLGYISLCAYLVMNQNAEELLICADKGGLKIPASKFLCRQYLFAARGTAQDIAALHLGVGASLVVQGQSSAPQREQVLQYLIGKGLDVNRLDRHQLSPLHAAVLANSPEEVQMLLNNGANPNLKDKKFGLTPLELAVQLQNEGQSQRNLSAVIDLLKNKK
jgi:ankyrin repeat protein